MNDLQDRLAAIESRLDSLLIEVPPNNALIIELQTRAAYLRDEIVRLHDERGKFRILFDVNEISYELFMFTFTVLKERTILVAYKTSNRGQLSNATGFFSNKLFIK